MRPPLCVAMFQGGDFVSKTRCVWFDSTAARFYQNMKKKKKSKFIVCHSGITHPVGAKCSFCNSVSKFFRDNFKEKDFIKKSRNRDETHGEGKANA